MEFDFEIIFICAQKLPDGSPKVIERFDCSGCGDVDTSKVVTASPEGVIIGVSGREIKVMSSFTYLLFGCVLFIFENPFDGSDDSDMMIIVIMSV